MRKAWIIAIAVGGLVAATATSASALTYVTTFKGTAHISGLQQIAGQGIQSIQADAAFTITSHVNAAGLTRLQDGGVDVLLGQSPDFQAGGVVLDFQIETSALARPSWTYDFSQFGPSNFDLAESFDGIPLIGIEGSAQGLGGLASGFTIELPGFASTPIPGNLDVPTAFSTAHGDFVVPGTYDEQYSIPGIYYDQVHLDLYVDSVDHTVMGAIPEPKTWALMILAFSVVGARLRATAGRPWAKTRLGLSAVR